MSKQTQGTMMMVGSLAGTAGLVAFVALMVLGEYAFSPALFLALLVAGAVALFLVIALHRKPHEPPMVKQAHAPAPRAEAPRPHPVAPGPGNSASPAPNSEFGATTPVQDSAHRPAAAATHDPMPERGMTPADAPASAPARTEPLEPSEAPVPAPQHAPALAGNRPSALPEPRAEGPDDLKRIKGIGPKLEEMCNSLGFYHFDQIANWSDAEVAWVDDNLEGFKGRVSRDNWVEQAKQLASGQETEFSRSMGNGMST